MIKVSQLICPFLSVVSLLQFFQHTNAFLQIHILCLIQLILQNISLRILGSNPHKFIVVTYGLHKFLCLNTQLAERITDRSASGLLLVSQQKHVFGILIPAVHFI